MSSIKIAVGLIIILLSFVFVMKNKGQSMMQALNAKKKQEYEEAMRAKQENTDTVNPDNK